MHKKTWFFKNKMVLGALGVMLAFALLATGCPNGNTDDPPPPATYTVTFNTDGGSTVDSLTVEEGKTVTKPDNPTKTGNTFAGWYRDAAKTTTLWNFDTDVIVQDTTIYAKWVTGEDVPSYEVTFDTDGGSTPPAKQTVVQGERAQEPAKPTKAGYIFAGWYNGNSETQWDFSTETVTKATTLTAHWTEAVTVKFETNGGSAIADVTVAKGTNISLYNYQPTRTGYVFDGWYTDADLTKPAGNYLNKVTESLTLYAKWTATSALATHAGVWRNSSGNEAYWLQADGTAWRFYYSNYYDNDSDLSFYKTTWSTSQIDGYTVTFTDTGFTITYSDSGKTYTNTYTKNTDNTQTPTAAGDNYLGRWVDGGQSIELRADKTAVLDNYGDTLALEYCVDGQKTLYLLQPKTNLVIISFDLSSGVPGNFSKPASDSSLTGIWKLTKDGQDYYWNLKADGSGTFHTLGASVPIALTVTENKRIDGDDYTVEGSTLTFPNAGKGDDDGITLSKVASVPAGLVAAGDSRLHATWKMTQGSETMSITLRSDGTVTQTNGTHSETFIWKADGISLFFYNPSFSYPASGPQKYSVSGSSLTVDNGYGEEYVLTK